MTDTVIKAETSERVHGFAEIECVIRDASGRVKDVEKKRQPVTYRFDRCGCPIDIQRE